MDAWGTVRGRVLGSVIVVLAAAVGLGLGALIVYWIWPVSVTGRGYFELADDATLAAHQSQGIVWIAWTGVAALLGVASLFRTGKGFGLVGGSLLAFGMTASHVWWMGLLVGDQVYDAAPGYSPWISPAFLYVIAGWAAVAAAVVILAWGSARAGRHVSIQTFPR